MQGVKGVAWLLVICTCGTLVINLLHCHNWLKVFKSLCAREIIVRLFLRLACRTLTHKLGKAVFTHLDHVAARQ